MLSYRQYFKNSLLSQGFQSHFRGILFGCFLLFYLKIQAFSY